MSTYAGQNLGAGRIDRIQSGLKSGFLLSLILTVVTSFLLLVFPSALASLMLSDQAIIARCIPYLRICGGMMWAISMLFLTRSTCQGMGNTIIPMISGFYEFAARVLVVLLFSSSYGFTAIAMSEVTAWAGALALNGIYLIFKLKSLKKKKSISI